MIIWFGEENDAIRITKIQWLKKHFGEKGTEKSLNQLDNNSLSPIEDTSFFGKKSKPEKLIISGHGNQNTFMNISPEDLLDMLKQKGLHKDRIESIWLLGCNIGYQTQAGDGGENYLKRFGRCVKSSDDDNISGIKIYGPRGLIGYNVIKLNKDGQEIVKVVGAYVATADLSEVYPFDQGMLLYNM